MQTVMSVMEFKHRTAVRFKIRSKDLNWLEHMLALYLFKPTEEHYNLTTTGIFCWYAKKADRSGRIRSRRLSAVNLLASQLSAQEFSESFRERMTKLVGLSGPGMATYEDLALKPVFGSQDGGADSLVGQAIPPARQPPPVFPRYSPGAEPLYSQVNRAPKVAPKPIRPPVAPKPIRPKGPLPAIPLNSDEMRIDQHVAIVEMQRILAQPRHNPDRPSFNPAPAPFFGLGGFRAGTALTGRGVAPPGIGAMFGRDQRILIPTTTTHLAQLASQAQKHLAGGYDWNTGDEDDDED